ncbi:MAG TPA: ABC transporter substrate-binding protein [Chloroflexota bacterium]|nr:ABC transporter substrate-binding protein [Chloroflexota bacterium]
MSFRRLSPILALLAALVLIAGPAPAQTVAAPVQQVQKVAYGSDFLISGTTAPIYIAIEKGYFAEGGIEVTVSRGFGSADAVKRAATGQADIVQGDIGTAMLLRSNEGAEVKVIAPLYDKLPHAVLYYEDQNITTPKDLEGKTLADAPGSAPRQIFPAFAAVAGVDISRVDWRSVDPTVRNTIFAAGQLEIISAFILNLADVEKLAYEQNPNRKIAAMRYADYGLNMYGNGYITSDKMIAERPEAVAAFVAGAAKGLRDTYMDIPAAVATVQRMAPEANVNAEIATRQLELIRDLVLTENSSTMGIGSFQESQLTATRSVMMRYLGMKSDLALTDVAAPQFTPATPVLP